MANNRDIKVYGQISADHEGLINIIDTYDRPHEASADGVYAEAGTFAQWGFEDKPGKRIPKAGAHAGIGVGRYSAAWSVLSVEAKGPHAYAGAEASAALLGARAFAGAEVAIASVSVGPLKTKVGLSVETGLGFGTGGVEAKVLGTGFSIGRKISYSLLGNGFEFTLW